MQGQKNHHRLFAFVQLTAGRTLRSRLAGWSPRAMEAGGRHFRASFTRFLVRSQLQHSATQLLRCVRSEPVLTIGFIWLCYVQGISHSKVDRYNPQEQSSDMSGATTCPCTFSLAPLPDRPDSQASCDNLSSFAYSAVLIPCCFLSHLGSIALCPVERSPRVMRDTNT
jgi:hypothetical protein